MSTRECVCAQIVNLGTYVAVNSLALESNCSLFANAAVWLNIVMWTMWNTVRMQSPQSDLCCVPVKITCA